MEILI
ncbi:hypothetical protein F383_02613 [Gossypium arboreum]